MQVTVVLTHDVASFHLVGFVEFWLVTDKDTFVHFFTMYKWLIVGFLRIDFDSIGYCAIVTCAHNLKLLRIPFVEKRDGHAHDTVVVFGNELDLVDVDGIGVVVCWIRIGCVMLHHEDGLMTAMMVEVGEPTGIGYPGRLACH